MRTTQTPFAPPSLTPNPILPPRNAPAPAQRVDPDGSMCLGLNAGRLIVCVSLRHRGDLLLVLERVQSLLVLERELRLLLRIHRAQVRVCACDRIVRYRYRQLASNRGRNETR